MTTATTFPERLRVAADIGELTADRQRMDPRMSESTRRYTATAVGVTMFASALVWAAVPASAASAAAPAAAVGVRAAAAKPTFTSDAAKYGVSGSESVRNLQRKLIAKKVATPGLRAAGATGNYLTQTRLSVKRFQLRIGYSSGKATGIADKRSVKKLGLRWVTAAPASGSTTQSVGGSLPAGTNGAALSAVQLKTVLQNAGFREPAIRTAYGIAMRESRGYPAVVSPKNSNGTQDHGLFQINDVHRATTDFTNIYNAEYNARVAYRLSNGGNDWGAWGVGTTGWAGTLKRTQPKYWQMLQDEMERFKAQYPG